MTNRKPAAELLTRTDAEAMIAEAVAKERERNDRVVAGLMLAFGEAVKVIDQAGDAIVEQSRTIARHGAFLEPLAAMVAAGLGVSEATESASD